jgi:hypothetical protein
MQCDRCGGVCNERVFIPPFVRGSSLVSTFERGKWICKKCLILLKQQRMNTGK